MALIVRSYQASVRTRSMLNLHVGDSPKAAVGGLLAACSAMSNLKDKIDNAADKAKDVADKTGERIERGADKVADKTNDLADKVKDLGKDANKKIGG